MTDDNNTDDTDEVSTGAYGTPTTIRYTYDPAVGTTGDNTETPPATTLRSRTILGDASVKQEVQFINQVLKTSSEAGNVRAVVDTGPVMAGKYTYGHWFLLEEIFQYGAAWTGDPFTSIMEIPDAQDMTMPELMAAIKEKEPQIFQRHKQINAVLTHFRKLGYQIHPGNWFDARVTEPIKWVINWNNTILDHISIIDDTLVIGKPDQMGPVGPKERSGEALTQSTSGVLAPVEGLTEPIHPQTKINFFGLGDKGNGQVVMRPAGQAMGTENYLYEDLNTDISGGSYDFADPGDTNGALNAVMGLINTMAGNIDNSMGQLSGIGLFRTEVDNDFARVPGIINSGDGTVQDVSNVTTFSPTGKLLTGGSLIDEIPVGGTVTINGVPVAANPWVFVNLSGHWYAATWEWMRPGQVTKSRKAVNGDHIKQPPLASWSPSTGETLYFMVSGLARGSERNVNERSNLIKVTWPAPGGSTTSSQSSGMVGASWLHHNVSSWPVTSKLSSVTVTAGNITLNHDKASAWASVGDKDGGNGGSITTFIGIHSFSALGAGAVWKPKSEKDNKLVVVLPSKYAKTTVIVGGDTGVFTGFNNGNRGHYRFPKPGDGYEPAVSVTVGNTSFTVNNPARRIG